MATHPFGQAPFAEGELGDLAGTIRSRGASAALVTYALQPPASAKIAVTYGVQGALASTAVVTYSAVPVILGFSINGAQFPAPHHVVYQFPTTVGQDQTAVPLRQGYTILQWQYDVMLDAQMQQLMNAYNPAKPTVVITYPNELGQWVTKQAQMQPPTLGTRSTIEHRGVSVTFTHISSD